jgi:hypothetical protein
VGQGHVELGDPAQCSGAGLQPRPERRDHVGDAIDAERPGREGDRAALRDGPDERALAGHQCRDQGLAGAEHRLGLGEGRRRRPGEGGVRGELAVHPRDECGARPTESVRSCSQVCDDGRIPLGGGQGEVVGDQRVKAGEPLPGILLLANEVGECWRGGGAAGGTRIEGALDRASARDIRQAERLRHGVYAGLALQRRAGDRRQDTDVRAQEVDEPDVLGTGCRGVLVLDVG